MAGDPGRAATAGYSGRPASPRWPVIVVVVMVTGWLAVGAWWVFGASRESGDVAVPDVAGSSVDDAADLLDAAGLGVTTTQAVPSTLPAEQVAGSRPAAGEPIRSGGWVVLLVSTGQPPVEPTPAPTTGPAASPAAAESAAAAPEPGATAADRAPGPAAAAPTPQPPPAAPDAEPSTAGPPPATPARPHDTDPDPPDPPAAAPARWTIPVRSCAGQSAVDRLPYGVACHYTPVTVGTFVVGHDYRGNSWWNDISVGSRVALTGRLAGTYTVTHRVYAPGRGPQLGPASAWTCGDDCDLILQTCDGLRTGFTWLQRQ